MKLLNCIFWDQYISHIPLGQILSESIWGIIDYKRGDTMVGANGKDGEEIHPTEL